MRASIGYDGEAEGAALRLEDEVASWRSRRVQRPTTRVGKVHVVRISKRVISRPRTAADRVFSTRP